MGLSTHVLDTAKGMPAAGLPVRVEALNEETWIVMEEAVTDGDGRCAPLVRENLPEGRYRIRFETAAYFREQAVACLYPYVEIVFDVSEARHHHIPLLIAGNGYTTYRGS